MPQQYKLTQEDVAFMRSLALNSDISDRIRTVDFSELEKRVLANPEFQERAEAPRS